jgi:hypothetical protein
MSSLILMKPLTFDASSVATSAGATGQDNLLSPNPKEVWSDGGGAGAKNIDIDLGLGSMGGALSVDSIFFGFIGGASYTTPPTVTVTNSNTSGAWTQFSAFPAGTPVLAPSDRLQAQNRPYFQHGFLRLGAPIARRFWRIAWDSGITTETTIGIVGIGLSIQPLWGREWGSGRQVVDMSSVTQLKGGGFGIDRGARKPAFQFRCGDLQDSEVVQLWDMALDLGESAPVVVIEDPDNTAGLNERIHYGKFSRPEAYERTSPGNTAWAFRVEGWV